MVVNQNAAPALGPGQNAGACGAGVRQKAEGEQIEGPGRPQECRAVLAVLDDGIPAQSVGSGRADRSARRSTAKGGHTRTAPRTENCCISTSGIGQYKGVEHPPGAQAVK